MAVGSWQFIQHRSKGREYPSVTTRPEVFLASIGLMSWIDILGIAEVKSGLVVVHDGVSVLPVLIHFLEVIGVACKVIELSHDGHDHEQAVYPPEIVGG